MASVGPRKNLIQLVGAGPYVSVQCDAATGFPLSGLIDTGAARSAMSTQLLDDIGAPEAGFIVVKTIHGERVQELRWVSLQIRGDIPQVVSAIAMDHSDCCPLILGRDFLARYRVRHEFGRAYLTIERGGTVRQAAQDNDQLSMVAMLKQDTSEPE